MPQTTYTIHPAIGIARVGDSPGWFLGPEIPGHFDPPEGEWDRFAQVRSLSGWSTRRISSDDRDA